MATVLRVKDIWKALPLGVGLATTVLVVGCPSENSGPPASVNTPHAAVANGSSRSPNAAAPVSPPSAGLAKKESAPPTKTVAYHPPPMLNGWAKPVAVLVFSAEQHGYMEPCGCSATQSGGLSRRADFLRQLNEKHWPYAAVDLGGLVQKENQQNKFKFQVMLSALKDLGYKAMAIGTEELSLERLDPGFLLIQETQLAADVGSLFVSANVVFTQFKDAGVAVPSRIINVGGRSIGVTAILGKSRRTALFGDTPDPNISIADPEAVLPQAIAQLKKGRAEVLVLLCHASRDESLALAKQFPEFQLVVASGPEDGTDTPTRVGKSLYLEVGKKGKHVGVVGYYPDQKSQPFRFELVELDKERFRDTPKMLDKMREYQHMLEANYPAVLQDLAKAPHPSGDVFAGVETCKDCHKKAYAVWIDSKHAHGYESLISGREGTKDPIPRTHDPECLACHVTGWEPQKVFPYTSGFLSAEQSPHLKGQQCENCHGPSSRHNDLELKWKKNPASVKKEMLEAERKRLRLTEAWAKKNLCYNCHDLDNDPNFNFEEYWPQIKHPGRD